MKNHSQNNLFIMLLSVLPLLVFSVNSFAENTLPDKDKTILEQAGIPVYPGLQFVNGTLSGMVGVRFACADDAEKVREWYRSKLPEWALNDQYGSWILYNGKPGGGPAEYMSKNQVMVNKSENLQEWFGLPADVTTEVIIALPEATE